MTPVHVDLRYAQSLRYVARFRRSQTFCEYPGTKCIVVGPTPALFRVIRLFQILLVQFGQDLVTLWVIGTSFSDALNEVIFSS